MKNRNALGLVATFQHEVGNGESETAERVAKFWSGHPVDDRSNDGTESSAECSKRSEKEEKLNILILNFLSILI